MGCSEYEPFLCRYVDDDLDRTETEKVLEHLSDCRACQKELETMERLRTWLHAANSYEGILQIGQESSLLRALESWDAEDQDADAWQPVVPQGPGRLKGSIGDLKRLPWRALELLLNFLPSSRIWRYAIPLLLVAVAALLWMGGDRGKKVDVRELPASAFMTVRLSDQGTDETDFYVLEHTSQQPWLRYGDELPMIQFVSDSAP